MLNQSPKSARLEQLFLKLTTPSDRDFIRKIIGVTVTYVVTGQNYVKPLVMRRFLPKYLVITGGAFLALFWIYLII